MMKQYKQKQEGFIGIVFLVIALIGIVIAAISAMSRSSSTGTSEQTLKTNASVMLKQASDFKTGIDRMMVNGSSPSSITFDATVGSGLFDPTAGAQYAIKHIPPAKVMSSGTPLFTYSQQVRLPGIGAAATADYVVTVGPITEATCWQINTMLYNDGVNAAPAVSTGSLAAWTTTPAAIDDSAVASVNYLNRPEGCVSSASSGGFVYYKALVEN